MSGTCVFVVLFVNFGFLGIPLCDIIYPIFVQNNESQNKIKQLSHLFRTGDTVRIVEAGKSNKTIYVVKKLKRSTDGIPLYLLKSDSDPVMLLYYQSKTSHLERAN